MNLHRRKQRSYYTFRRRRHYQKMKKRSKQRTPFVRFFFRNKKSKKGSLFFRILSVVVICLLTLSSLKNMDILSLTDSLFDVVSVGNIKNPLIIVENPEEDDEGEEMPFTQEELALMVELGLLQQDQSTSPLVQDGETIYKNPTGEPEVIIYHTHTTESYFPSEQYFYTPIDSNSHTLDLDYSVVRVGKTLANTLRGEGISVAHEISVFNQPSQNYAYQNSGNALEILTERYSEASVLIDIHRDAVGTREYSRDIYLTEIDGVKMSKFSLVVAKGNDNYQENLKFVEEIQRISDELYPGLMKGIIYSEKNRYNQHFSTEAILVEVGSYGNTLEESLETSKLLGEILALAIDGQ